MYNGNHMKAKAIKDLYFEGYSKVSSKLHETLHELSNFQKVKVESERCVRGNIQSSSLSRTLPT